MLRVGISKGDRDSRPLFWYTFRCRVEPYLLHLQSGNQYIEKTIRRIYAQLFFQQPRLLAINGTGSPRRFPFAIGYGTTANLFLHYNRWSPLTSFFSFQITDGSPTWLGCKDVVTNTLPSLFDSEKFLLRILFSFFS